MNEPRKPTGKKRGKRSELTEWLAREKVERVGEAEFAALLAALAPVSEGYLKRLLRESGVALAPVVDGVRQSSLEELEASLCALLDEYNAGDSVRRRAVRKIVITAKDHAKWHPEGKEEMILWMTTWLENPPVFREWVALRKHAL